MSEGYRREKTGTTVIRFGEEEERGTSLFGGRSRKLLYNNLSIISQIMHRSIIT